MGFIVVAVIVIYFILNSQKAKNAKSWEQAKAQAQERAKTMEQESALREAQKYNQVAQVGAKVVQPRVAQQVGSGQTGVGWQCSCGQGGNRGMFCTNCGKAWQQNGSMSYVSQEGVSSEGTPNRVKTAVKPALRHVVAPSGKGAHVHMETSMGSMDTVCEEAYSQTEDDAYSQSNAVSAYSIDVSDRNAAVMGILYGEILGKPKSLRNAR